MSQYVPSFCLKLGLALSNLGQICRPPLIPVGDLSTCLFFFLLGFVSDFLGISFFWVRKDYYAHDNHYQVPVSFKL
jgi:hypothetical protein